MSRESDESWQLLYVRAGSDLDLDWMTSRYDGVLKTPSRNEAIYRFLCRDKDIDEVFRVILNHLGSQG